MNGITVSPVPGTVCQTSGPVLRLAFLSYVTGLAAQRLFSASSFFLLLSLGSVFDSPLGIMRYVSSTRSIASRGNSFNNDTRKVQHSHITTMLGSRSKHTTRTTLSLHSTQQFLCHLGPRLLCIPRNGHGWMVLCLGQAFDSSGLRQAALAQRLSFSVPVRSKHGTGRPRAGKDLASLTPFIRLLFSCAFFPLHPINQMGLPACISGVAFLFGFYTGSVRIIIGHRRRDWSLIHYTPHVFPFFLISFVLEV